MQPRTYLTLEEYLEIERGAEFRSEYIHGEMFAMAGGTPNHAWIIANTLTQLAQQLRGYRCGARSSDLRLYSAKHKRVTYPDIIVTCGPDQLLDARRDTLLLRRTECAPNITSVRPMALACSANSPALRTRST